MSLQEYYENSFQSEQNRNPVDMVQEALHLSKGMLNFVRECKDRFQNDKAWEGLEVCEMGSGRGGLSLHLSKLGAKTTLVDFSASALEQAEKIFTLENLAPVTIQADVTHPDSDLPQKYDLIVDSHLLHCLTFDPERSSYYQLVLDHLKDDGIFVVETMVHRKKLHIPDGFMFDQNNILWQMFGEWKPVRRILDSLDLEKELQEAGFKIAYFYYYAQFGFVPHKDFMDIPHEILPASVRMVLKK